MLDLDIRFLWIVCKAYCDNARDDILGGDFNSNQVVRCCLSYRAALELVAFHNEVATVNIVRISSQA